MRMVRLLITLAMIVTMLLISQKLHQGPADKIDLKSLPADYKDGADFCEDPVGYPTQLISCVLEKKRAHHPDLHEICVRLVTYAVTRQCL